MCRDMALAFFFGTAPELALFMVAYRFANLMRRMVAESPLSSSFVPAFETIRGRSEEEAAQFFRDLFFSLALIVLSIVACAMGGAFTLAQLFPTDARETSYLTAVMLPSLVFIALYGLSSVFLQCERHFFLPAVAPVAFNGVWIAVAWYAFQYPLSQAMEVLAYGVVLAFCMQWVVLIPKMLQPLRKVLSWRQLMSPRLFHPSLQVLVKPFLLGTLGVGATQINIALDSVFARMAHPEGPALLWYAVRIQQVPIALFGVAIATALLPTLTRSIKAQAPFETQALLKQGCQQTFALMVFSTCGLLALGCWVIWILFGRGEFQAHSVQATTQCLMCYALGLIPHGWTMLLASGYYAYADFKTPARGALGVVVLNIVLNTLMVFFLHWGPASMALGTSLTSMLNALYLHFHFKKHRNEQLVAPLMYFKMLGCGLVAFAVTRYLAEVWGTSFQMGSSWVKLSEFGTLSLLYLAVYCSMEKVLRCQEIFKLIKAQFVK